MRQIAHWLLDDSLDFRETCEKVRTLLDVWTEFAVTGERHYLDTTDRRLLHRGEVFECDVNARTSILTLRCGNALVAGPIQQPTIPACAADIADFDFRRRLNDGIGPRELAIVAKRPVHYELMRVRNKSQKTIARLYIEQFGADRPGKPPGPVIARLMALQGYRKKAQTAARVLNKNLPLNDAPSERAAGEMDRASARLPDCLKTQTPSLSGEASIADGVIKIITGNFRVITTREKGIEADLDTEFLHDFRIALRRMRSIFGAFDSIFTRQTVARLKPGLRWLNQVTGTRRDLDVYLHGFRQLEQWITPSNGDALQEVYRFITDERRREQVQLVRVLGSDRYSTFKSDWADMLRAPATNPAVANRETIDVAGASIWKAYKRIRRQIRSSNSGWRINALHELRKDCKKLRYLIEAFQTTYPAKNLTTAVRELKHLQDTLGAVCDNSVQRQFVVERENHMRQYARDPAQFENLLAELLAHYALEERRMLKGISEHLASFASQEITQTYRLLFKPRA